MHCWFGSSHAPQPGPVVLEPPPLLVPELLPSLVLVVVSGSLVAGLVVVWSGPLLTLVAVAEPSLVVGSVVGTSPDVVTGVPVVASAPVLGVLVSVAVPVSVSPPPPQAPRVAIVQYAR